MMPGDLRKEVQEQEVEVLRSIFDSELTDLRINDVWKVWRPPEILLHLLPSRGLSSNEAQKQLSSVDLFVKCGLDYPNNTPEVKVEKYSGLSEQSAKILQKELVDLAESLKGEVMILELAQHVQQFLFEHARPTMQSFYQEMVQRRQQELVLKEEEKLKCSVIIKEEELEAFEREVRRKQEEFTGLRRRREEEQEEIDFGGGDYYMPAPSTSSAVRETAKEVDVNNYQRCRKSTERNNSLSSSGDAELRKCVKLNCSIRGQDTTVVAGIINEFVPPAQAYLISAATLREYIGISECDGQLVHVEEWTFSLPNSELETEAIVKMAQALEKEFVSVVLKLDQRNLLKYFGINLCYNKSQITLLLAKEHLHHSLCVRRYCKGSESEFQTYSMQLLRELCVDVLNALAYLHSKGIVHRSLDLSCVYQTDTGGFLVSDYCLPHRIYELVKAVATALLQSARVQSSKYKRSSTSSGSTIFMPPAPGHVIAAVGKMNQKSDVFLFGLLLLSLVTGRDQFEAVSAKLPAIPGNLLPVLANFLSHCLNASEYERWTVNRLLQHSFLRETVPAELELNNNKNYFNYNNNVNINNDNAGVEQQKHQLGGFDNGNFYTSATAGGAASSRLQNEFFILDFLGRGAFGDVVKVRNKLDGGVYAIKRILLDPNTKLFNKKITREVKLLSRLNHENVVRYYNSWIEVTAKPDAYSFDQSSSVLPSLSHRLKSKTRKTGNFSAKIQQKQQQQQKVVTSEKEQILNIGKAKDPFAEESVLVDDRLLAPAGQYTTTSSATNNDGTSSGSSSEDSDSSSNSSSSSSEELLDVFGGSFCRAAAHGGDRSFCAKTTGLPQPSTSTATSDDVIVFERKVGKNMEEDSAELGETPPDALKVVQGSSGTERQETVQILYIQMEFCERSTLRQSIDTGELMLDRKRTWRLFRELVEGLNHIHGQGMIHRDLKPVNIFLDSGDHVKIGDFGLATQGGGGLVNLDTSDSAADVSTNNINSPSLPDAATGCVGTALYVSPELGRGTVATYTHKVDLYSLGIICFEMFSPPLGTGMERVKVLLELRKPEINMPTEFAAARQNEKLICILRRLLCHNVDERLSAQELLQSDLLPPLEMEESEYQTALRSALSNPQTRKYKYTIAAFFDQTPSNVQDYIYDCAAFKNAFSVREPLLYELVHDRLVAIFRTHGAVQLILPMLLPKNKQLLDNVDACFQMVDKSGLVVTLPFDLRYSFARFVARTNAMLKRYCIEKVFRELDVPGYHPRELTECAFDITTKPSGALPAAAEVLLVANEIVNAFECLREKRYVIKLNHLGLLKSVLQFSGIQDPVLQANVTQILDDSRSFVRKNQKHMKLRSLGISEQSITSLFNLTDFEGPLSKVLNVVKPITSRRKEKYASTAKQALYDLEMVCNYAQTLGVSLPIMISVKLTHNSYEYNGLIWKIVSETALSGADFSRQRQKTPEFSDGGEHTKVEILAAGGRYDELVPKFRKPSLDPPAPIAAVGISVSVDRILHLFGKCIKSTSTQSTLLLQRREDEKVENKVQGPNASDVIVCFVGSRLLIKEILALCRSFWQANIRCDYCSDPVLSLEDFIATCAAAGTTQIVALKTDSDGSTSVVVKSLDRVSGKQLHEKKFPSAPSADVVKHVGGALFEVANLVAATMKGSRTNNAQTSLVPSQIQIESCATGGGMSNVRIEFVWSERLASNTKRRHEAQIMQTLVHLVQRFAQKETVSVIGCDLPGAIVKSASSLVDLSSETEFDVSMAELLSKHVRFKKQLSLIAQSVASLKFDQNCNVIVLYSCTDDVYKVLL